MKRSINYLHIGIVIAGYLLLSFIVNFVSAIIQRKRQRVNHVIQQPINIPGESQTQETEPEPEIVGFYPTHNEELE